MTTDSLLQLFTDQRWMNWPLRLTFVVALVFDAISITYIVPGWMKQRRRQWNRRHAVLSPGQMHALDVEIEDYEKQIRQPKLHLALLLSVQFAGLLVVLQPNERRWQLMAALLPLLLVLYHAGHLWLETPNARAVEDSDEHSLNRVRKRIRHHYGWETIFARYVVPAFLIVAVGLVHFELMNWVLQTFHVPVDRLERPFKYGLVGAYFYVFLELGRRSVRHDITPVSVVWSLITLAVGPMLAVIMSSVFARGSESDSLWKEPAIWVFAGYSPRLVFRTLAQGVAKSLKADTSAIQEERQIPLGRIEGIGAEEAERLAEEGIRDVHALACVEPVRLMRDTRFDNWRILSWIDQALLLSVVPEGVWRAFLKRSYQGATDAMSLVFARPKPGRYENPISSDEARVILTKLAEEAGVEEPVVRDMLIRLSADPRTLDVVTLTRAIMDDGVLVTAAPTVVVVKEPDPADAAGGAST